MFPSSLLDRGRKWNIFVNKHVIYQNFANFMQIKEIDVNKLENVIFTP